MDKTFGWLGKILRVDLSTGKTHTVPTRSLAENFIGGKGFAAKIYWDEVGAAMDALSPENPLMLIAGPAGGTGAIACSRLVTAFKSPLLYPEQFVSGSMGGGIADKLKVAGFDGLIVVGKALGPVCLCIHGDSVEIQDSCNLQGRDCFETLQRIRSKYGNGAEALCIGPAGESGVRFAIALGYNGACASHGFGAVMGSKNLKAIIVQGSGRVPVARLEDLKAINRQIRSDIKGRVLIDPMIDGIDLVRRTSCRSCPAGCSRGLYRHTSGVEDVRKHCASAYFYSDWEKKHNGDEASGNSFLATSFCNRMGLCTNELFPMLLWFHACSRQGVLADHGTGLPVSEMGSQKFLETFVRKVVAREGFGDVLAEGTLRAGKQVGKESEKILERIVEGAGYEAYSARCFITTAIIHATDTVNPSSQFHELCYPVLFNWMLWYATDGAMSPLNTEALRRMAGRFWKNESAVDFSTYTGKGEVGCIIQNRAYAKETLVGCDFFYPMIFAEGVEGFVGDPTVESRVLSAVTGLDCDEDSYYRVGERVFNLVRAVRGREIGVGRKHDVLPEFNFTEPLEEDKSFFGLFNPEFMMPGSGGELITRKGSVVDRAAFEKMMDEYYGSRGWDVKTGLQTKKRLQALALEEVIADLEARGLVV